MAFTRALAIVSLASLPLAALTARAFFMQPLDPGASCEVPHYQVDPALQSRIDKASGQLLADDRDEDGNRDPTGWRTATNVDALPEPYDVAAAIRLADGAIQDSDATHVDAAITALTKFLDEPRRLAIEKWRPAGQSLVKALRERKERLEMHRRRLADRAEAHRRWLEDRASVAAEIHKAETALADPSIAVGADAAILILQNLRQRYPGVVPDNEEAEPPTRRTASEDDTSRHLLKRAEFRRQFERAGKANAGMGRKVALENFLRTYDGGPPDERDQSLLDDAKGLLDEATREVLWSRVQAADSAGDLAQSLCEWLKAADDADSIATARKVTVVWLAKRITAGPDVMRFDDLQEGMVDSAKGAKRLLGVFEEAVGENRWRWWEDKAQKADPKFTRGAQEAPVALKGEPFERPVLIDLLDTYRQQRTRFIDSPLELGDERSPAMAFATACDNLQSKARKHAGVSVVDTNPHPLQQDYDAILEQVTKSLGEASKTAREFDEAVRRSGLANKLKE